MMNQYILVNNDLEILHIGNSTDIFNYIKDNEVEFQEEILINNELGGCLQKPWELYDSKEYAIHKKIFPDLSKINPLKFGEINSLVNKYYNYNDWYLELVPVHELEAWIESRFREFGESYQLEVDDFLFELNKFLQENLQKQ